VSVEAILSTARSRAGSFAPPLTPGRAHDLFAAVRVGLRTFLADPRRREACLDEVRKLLGLPRAEGLHTVKTEPDVVACRTAARELSAALGFSTVDQTKIATVVSELARNIVRYAAPGTIELKELRDALGAALGIEVRARDEGPGIAGLDDILAGRYRSKTGMGLGLLGAKRLMSHLEIETSPGRGTTVVARRTLTPGRGIA
jgi:serine/threonine-protein kinase RsbT